MILEDYERFVDEVSGMTDEEYAAKMAQQSEKEAVVEDEDADQAESDEAMQIPQDLTVISIAVLDKMAEFAKTGDFEQVRTHLDRLKSYGYDGDNLEFLQALSEAAESENADMITELVNTYQDLKL